MKKGYLRNVVNESYLKPLKEEVNTGSFVYVLIDPTPYEFDVYGIYSDLRIAQRALQAMQKEDGTHCELKKVPLNQEPGYNYIPNE